MEISREIHEQLSLYSSADVKITESETELSIIITNVIIIMIMTTITIIIIIVVNIIIISSFWILIPYNILTVKSY